MGDGQQQAASPARTYATVVGGGMILLGLTGFFYSSSFATSDGFVAEKAFGLFYVNGWQNTLHLAAGALGLALAMRGARLYCLGSGVVWIVLAAGGFFGSHGGEEVPSMGGFLPAGTATNLLNLALGCLALAVLAGPATARVPPAARRKKTGQSRRKPRQKAEKQLGAKPKVKPETKPGEPTIGRPRSARQGTRAERGPIN